MTSKVYTNHTTFATPSRVAPLNRGFYYNSVLKLIPLITKALASLARRARLYALASLVGRA